MVDLFLLLTSSGGVSGEGVVDPESWVGRFVDCCLSVCTHSSLPLGLSFCVDGEGVDCDCLADLLLSGGSVAVGG